MVRNERSSIERGSETGKGREAITREHETVKHVAGQRRSAQNFYTSVSLEKILLCVYIIQACLELMISLVWITRNTIISTANCIGSYYTYLSSNILCFPKSHTYQLSTLNFLAIWMDCFY